MCVRYNGATSNFEKCPGGGPQGGLLTGLLFCLQVNKAGSPCTSPIMPQLEGHQTLTSTGMDTEDLHEQLQEIHGQHSDATPRMESQQDQQSELEGPDEAVTQELETQVLQQQQVMEEIQEEPASRMERRRKNTALRQPLCTNIEKTHKKSYIDDLTLLEKISLRNLVEEERIIGPPTFHGRLHLKMPPQKMILQHQLEDLVKYTQQNHMILNKKKTKCLPFINSRTKDFEPKLYIEKDTNLEIIYKLKLVGIVVTSDLLWDAHIEYTVKRVNSVLWQLTRFRQQGASREQLIKFYILKIRSVLMFGAVCFHTSLTQDNSRRLELQQKRSLACILGLD